MQIDEFTYTHRFDGPRELVRFLNDNKEPGASGGNDWGTLGWHGGQTLEEAKQRALTGYEDATRRASVIFDTIMSKRIVSRGSEWVTSASGSFPCVPAFLAGEPECMYRKSENWSNMAPMRVFISTGTQGDVSSQLIETRGAHALALVMVISQFRAVEVYTFSDIGTRGMACIPVTKIESMPLDMASASYALGNAAFHRRLCFDYLRVCAKEQGTFSIGCGWPPMRVSDEYHRKVKAVIGCTDDDLYLPRATSVDESYLNPESWIDKQIAKYTSSNEAEE